jgi:hypothetical protein
LAEPGARVCVRGEDIRGFLDLLVSEWGGVFWFGLVWYCGESVLNMRLCL